MKTTPYDALTRVQRDVLRNFLLGMEDEEIAEKLMMPLDEVARIVDELDTAGWTEL